MKAPLLPELPEINVPGTDLTDSSPAEETGQGMAAAATFEITVSGLVQGIGFRPYIYRLARDWSLRGNVSNTSEGVTITLTTDPATLEKFLTTLHRHPPVHSRITGIGYREIPYTSFDTFGIADSGLSTGAVSLLYTPDLSLCRDCREEMHTPGNRRYRYPFITCARCGPRYSVIRALPYDRPHTSMDAFRMCPLCDSEYHDPADRRFYAQTNSCPACGPQLTLYVYSGAAPRIPADLTDTESVLARVKRELQDGAIVAVKGIGGYLLLCDATCTGTVERLRERKHRPSKPLAVLFSSVSQLTTAAIVTPAEKEALESPASPIVIVRKKPGHHSVISEAVAPGFGTIGAMLPCAPLLALIAEDFGKPLVATSANISGSPLFFRDKKAIQELCGIADSVLVHNREIYMPQDDTVIRFTSRHQERIILRRGRGLAPDSDLPVPGAAGGHLSALAFGADLKSSFAFLTENRVYISQYLSDLESFDAQETFREVAGGLLSSLGFSLEPGSSRSKPQRLAADAHPGYASSQYAEATGKLIKTPVEKIQHHYAHLAAVSGEHGLHPADPETLGVIWDGTGYGSDGMIWGGEFLFGPQRLHFPYFPWLSGDRMAAEPRFCALSLLHTFGNAIQVSKIRRLFSDREWEFLNKALQKPSLLTSSIGRVFDGVAALLDIGMVQTFEGEAAMRLEEAAARYLEHHPPVFDKPYLDQDTFHVGRLLSDLEKGEPADKIAARFHCSLVAWIASTAAQLQPRRLAFGGGVFQNAVLQDLILTKLGTQYQLLFQRKLAPNDECIAYGQVMQLIS